GVDSDTQSDQVGRELWRQHFQRGFGYGVRNFMTAHASERLSGGHVDDASWLSSLHKLLTQHSDGADIHGIVLIQDLRREFDKRNFKIMASVIDQNRRRAEPLLHF